MTAYEIWARRHPQAAAEMQQLIGAIPWPANDLTDGKSEAWAQQRTRFNVARQGAMAWRNNVGATPTKEKHECPNCSFRFQVKKPPIRYGLANDSTKLNKEIKSGDLILAIPRLITPQMVGTKIAQFGSAECKPPGWKYAGTGEEPGQAAWATLLRSIGAYATFTTGEIEL